MFWIYIMEVPVNELVARSMPDDPEEQPLLQQLKDWLFLCSSALSSFDRPWKSHFHLEDLIGPILARETTSCSAYSSEKPHHDLGSVHTKNPWPALWFGQSSSQQSQQTSAKDLAWCGRITVVDS